MPIVTFPFFKNEDKRPEAFDTDNRESLQSLCEKLLSINRLDLIVEIERLYGRVSLPVFHPSDVPSIKDETHTWKGLGDRPPGYISVHRHSAAEFVLASTGHNFTGMVRLPKPGSAGGGKMFLFPLHHEGNTRVGVPPPGGPPSAPEDRGGKPWAGGTSARVYKKEFPLIQHGGKDNPSHGKLKEHIGEKEDLGNEFFVGFTISKGNCNLEYPNRYRFTSQSMNSVSLPRDGSNPRAPVAPPVAAPAKVAAGKLDPSRLGGMSLKFGPVAAYGQARVAPAGVAGADAVNMYVTKPWGQAIQKAGESLLRLDGQLQRVFPDIPAFVAAVFWLDSDDVAKERWKLLKQKYWTDGDEALLRQVFFGS
jgi:hypothetical protein